MFGLKVAYFYFVAIQITLIKFFKTIYFSTNAYNKSLISKIPTQVYFNPNPFLLSIISPYKKKLFKINDINPNNFWLENKDKNTLDQHNFLWLNLIDRKIDGKNIQKIIYLWMLKYSNFKRKIWETSTLSSRVISWMLNIDIIINNGTFDFKKTLFQNIICQCNHLKKNIKFEKDPIKRIEVLSALTLSGIIFKEYEENYKIGVKELEKFVKNYFDKDGFPLTRSPNDHICFTKYLILCHESIKDAQHYMPEFLDDIIRKNLRCIKFLKAPNNQFPLFNGGSENKLDNFDKYLEDFKLSKKDAKDVIGGIFHAKTKNQNLYFDVGPPPEKAFSKNYQSGPLSFEYFIDGIKIVTNCGFGDKISGKAELLSRLTASQSTLTINDTTITKFERNKLINRTFGNSIKNTFKTTELKIKNDKDVIGSSISHNGYEKDFNCIHKREVYLDVGKNKLQGIDHILKKSDGTPIRYVFRFHLNPKLSVVKTMSGNSALIQLSKNKSLIFTVKDENIELEKSVYLGGKKMLDNTCITISGNLVNKNKSFNWEIKKKI
tara:strand:- start:1888 stop:3531 length:1644 start_codon:yes stop_codon:yes gene_type:complete